MLPTKFMPAGGFFLKRKGGKGMCFVPGEPALQPPGAPTGFAVDTYGSAAFVMSWAAPESGGEVEAYRLQCQYTGSDWSSPLAETIVSEPSGYLGFLPDNTICDLRVRAENAAGNSDWVTLSGEVTLPPVPSNLSTIADNYASGQREITVGWDQIIGLNWEVERDAGVPESNGTNNSYFFTIALNTAYAIRVRAINASGAGPWSVTLSMNSGGEPEGEG